MPDQPRFLFERGAFSHVPIVLGATRDEGWTFVQRSFPAGMTAEQYEAAVDAEFGIDAPAILAAYPADDFASPRDALARIVGDVEYAVRGSQARSPRRAIRNTRVPVFVRYEVDPVALDRVVHGLDVNFVFGTTSVRRCSRTTCSIRSEERSRDDGGYWTRFATTAIPTPTIRLSSTGRHSRARAAQDVASTSTSF